VSRTVPSTGWDWDDGGRNEVKIKWRLVSYTKFTYDFFTPTEIKSTEDLSPSSFPQMFSGSYYHC